mmetsp:Transcript_43599/g.92776  ORF Transcript_43599/g.92776 Transcript_43599/m.92776 type:complete len:208 (-) Transcript_43599:19-642(-)
MGEGLRSRSRKGRDPPAHVIGRNLDPLAAELVECGSFNEVALTVDMPRHKANRSAAYFVVCAITRRRALVICDILGDFLVHAIKPGPVLISIFGVSWILGVDDREDLTFDADPNGLVLKDELQRRRCIYTARGCVAEHIIDERSLQLPLGLAVDEVGVRPVVLIREAHMHVHAVLTVVFVCDERVLALPQLFASVAHLANRRIGEPL